MSKILVVEDDLALLGLLEIALLGKAYEWRLPRTALSDSISRWRRSRISWRPTC